MIDKALEIAARPNVIFTLVRRMLRVPGSTTDLLSVKARGGDVRIVYSPLDAVKLRNKIRRRKSFFLVSVLKPPRRDGDGGLSGGAEKTEKLFHAHLARAGAARHGGIDVVAGLQGAGISRRGPRLRGDGVEEYVIITIRPLRQEHLKNSNLSP